jgi:hypothetical protein
VSPVNHPKEEGHPLLAERSEAASPARPSSKGWLTGDTLSFLVSKVWEGGGAKWKASNQTRRKIVWGGVYIANRRKKQMIKCHQAHAAEIHTPDPENPEGKKMQHLLQVYASYNTDTTTPEMG